MIEKSTKIYITDAFEESLKWLGELTTEYYKKITGK